MSSMSASLWNIGRLTLATALITAASASAQTESAPAAPVPMVQPIPGTAAYDSNAWQKVRSQISNTADSSVLSTVDEWRRLQQSDNLGFWSYAGFILANPGWPGEDRMRKLAESGIDPNSYEPSRVISFFARYPAKTAVGHARYALALSAMGRMDEARTEARNAWISGPLSPDDENRILTYFGSTLTNADHDARADMLLWSKNTSGAERVLAYVSPARRPAFEARIAMQRKSGDAANKVASAEATGAADAGFLGDKAMWLRDSGNSMAARSLLSNRAVLQQRPADPEEWYEALLTNARAAANDSQWSYAWGIASRVDDAFPAGIDMRDQSLGVRDDYTSLVWLAGTTAYYNLNKPADAVGMFQRYATAARSPQTISKGYYWAGRAALASGDNAGAMSYFEQASAYPDQFYGQLALERLGRTVPAPDAVQRPVELTEADHSAFAASSVVRAAKALGATGQWEDQTKFLRAIAANAQSDKDHRLADDLARSLSRPDLGVMVGRRAVADGLTGYSSASFPQVSVPGGHEFNWTMIHAISRQESQFDRAAVSHAGARGLMQLMPGTAREQAGKVGLSYNMSSLTSDTTYNIQLGSGYFQRMLDYYSGCYPLAVAAYNAGPGNVNKWIAANGDPRLSGSDMLRWIEQIPIYETRNYVQRVLENAVVYDTINPARARFPGSKTMLSRYLGKNQPG